MTNVPVYLGLGGFPGHRTSSANTGKILRRSAWWVALGGRWAFGDRGKHRVEPVCRPEGPFLHHLSCVEFAEFPLEKMRVTSLVFEAPLVLQGLAKMSLPL